MSKHNHRFIAPAKKIMAGRDSSNLSIIIPAAGTGKKMKSYGPRSLIELKNGQTVLYKQLSVLSEVYPNAEIIVVIGFEAFKVFKHIPRGIRAVVNHQYEDTSVLYSICLGLMNAINDNILIVYGDLVFNHDAVDSIPTDTSRIVVDTQNQFNEAEVGVVLEDTSASYFSYGMPTKWSQITFLTGKELELFRNLTIGKDKQKTFTFEVLNEVIERIGSIPTFENKNARIVEIDSIKNVIEATNI